MRTNLPVTTNEIRLDDNTLIVSKTDLQGRITYVNKGFLEISGFTEAELIGQPHNIVRHPDMPVEAFADLWKTLQAGRPWTGLVKNRAKNGDYYWVSANATPIWEGGQITGYMSLRRKAPAESAAAAEGLYRQVREGRAGNIRILHGQAVKGRGDMLKNQSVGRKLGAVMLFLMLTLLMQGVIGLFMLSRTNDAVTTMSEQRTEPLRLIGRISRLMADNRTQVLLGLQHDPSSPSAKLHDHPHALHMDAVRKNIAEISELWDAYAKAIHDDEHKKLAEAFVEARKKFVQEGLLPTLKAQEGGDFTGANLTILKQVNPLYNAASGKADALFVQLSERAKTDRQMSDAAYARTQMQTYLGVALAVALAIGLTLWLRRSIIGPLQTVVETLRNVAQGNYSNRIDVSCDDELGKVLQGLQSMQTRLGFEVAESKRIADETLRVKIALDNVSTGVMIANGSREIIYTNKAVQRILKGAEPDIRKALPNFNADKLLGTNIDSFHKNPSHQANLLSTFTSPYTANLEVGGRSLRVTASPVINDSNERLGAVAEWLDRTQEVQVEKEVASIVDAAQHGDFNQRLSLDGKQGFFKQLAEGLNSLSQVTSTGLNDVAHVLQSIAQGDLTRKIEADYSGIFGQLKDDTNATVERLREVVGRIKEATESINTAAQEIAAGNQDLSSRTEEQASSLEETSSSMEELNATVRNNAANANKANQLAKTSSEGIQSGGEAVGQVVITMSAIQESSKKIADIIGVIDSIAFQTNILALNAAVEAARAGEQGRGFAVVATEVRNLAQRSATAAKEIKDLIAASVEKVDVGVKQVEQAGTTMKAVVISFTQVATLVTDIANASREQSAGIEQVTQAIGSMDEVTQQNAALVEEAAAAAESLEEQARGLVQAVGMFKLAEGQSRLSARPTHSAPTQRAPARPTKVLPKKAGMPAADNGEEWAEF
jgi:methyl-accepting chemotaxis protein